MVCAPHAAQDIDRIGKIQRRTARFVHDKYHYYAGVTKHDGITWLAHPWPAS